MNNKSHEQWSDWPPPNQSLFMEKGFEFHERFHEKERRDFYGINYLLSSDMDGSFWILVSDSDM